jgi:hypothetical protein
VTLAARHLQILPVKVWARRRSRHAAAAQLSLEAAETRAKCEEEIRRFTGDLKAEGRYLTMKLVKSQMIKPGYFDYVTFWTILCDEKRRLATD